LRVSGYGLGNRKGGVMKSYKDLEIYNLSYELAIKIHKMSLELPKYELYEEGSQIRRSSKGIPTCIAEGYGRRRYKADFIKFLVYSHASCDETIVHLNFIKDIHEIDKDEIHTFINSYNELGGKINKFISYVENEWK
jgi:four helix bundle protein